MLSYKRFLVAPIVSTFALLVVVTALSISSVAQVRNLVTAPVDASSRLALRGQRAPWTLAEYDRGPLAGDPMLEHLTVVLQRSPQQQALFEQFLKQQQDPASPNYHRWLTPVEVGEMFGASSHDIEAVSEWLRSAGLRVENVSNSRTMIDFSGSASAVGAAFATQMHLYDVNGEERIATADEPQIPSALAPVVRSVIGLYTIPNRSFASARTAEASTQPAGSFCSGSNCNYYVFPGDFATIYDLAPVYNLGFDGTGQTIGIIGRARVFNPDIENFQARSAQTAKDPVVTIPPLGTDPGNPDSATNPAPGDQLEATLDVMRSTSIAPGATIDLIVSKSSQTLDGIAIASEYAIDTTPVPAQILNISFGLCEQQAGLSGVTFWDNLFGQAAAEGISVFVASGDAGAAGCDAYFQVPPQSQVRSPNYICSSGFSTCVGGTEFADAANPTTYWSNSNGTGFESALAYIPEGAWNEPLNGSTPQAAGTGGGVSSFIAKPSWQTGTGVPNSPNGRFTPDLAFTSSGHDGYFGCLAADGGSCVVSGSNFNFLIFFGTSAAAPDMAGITALLNQKMGAAQGSLNPRLYQLAATPANSVFHDATVATSGVVGCVITTPSMCNNSTASNTGLTGGLQGFLLTAGFDEATGLGSTDVANLLSNWVVGSASTTTVTSSLNPASQGVAVTFTATVSSGTTPPTGSITFKDGSNSLGTSPLNGSAQATLTTSTLTGGTHSITAVYSGDSNNAPSTSAILFQTIVGNTTTTLTSSANPASSGASITFTSMVTGAIPTGTVTFYNGVTPLGTANLSSGRATLTTNSLVNTGTDSVTAVYNGDSKNQTSTSSPVQQAINASSFTISATPSTLAVGSGSSAAFNITVTPQGSYTSTVSFSATLTPASSATVSFNPSTLVPNGTATPTVLTIQGATSGPLHAALLLPDAGQSAFADRQTGRNRMSAMSATSLWMSLGIAGVLLVGGKKNAKHSARHYLRIPCLALLAVTMMTILGCGSSNSHPGQSYQVQVTATGVGNGNSGAVTTSTTVTLTVH